MKCQLNCTNPEEIEYTITMTAPAKEWRELYEHIPNKFANFELLDNIRGLLAQANKTYRGEE